MIKVGEIYEAALLDGEDNPSDLVFYFKILAEQRNDNGTFYCGAKVLPSSEDFNVTHHGSMQWFCAEGLPVDGVNKNCDSWFELIID